MNKHAINWVRKLRWPLDTEDTLVWGGTLAVGIGTGSRWGWDVGLTVFGSILLLLVVTSLIGKVLNGPHN